MSDLKSAKFFLKSAVAPLPKPAVLPSAPIISSDTHLQIDTELPSRFDLKEIKREDPTEPKVKFIFDAEDELSGIDYYEIMLDDQEAEIWRKDKTDYYETPELKAGKHILIAKAVDKAGNFLENSAEFIIEAPPSEPVIAPSAPPTLFPVLSIPWIVIIGIIILQLISIVLFLVILRKIKKQKKTFPKNSKRKMT